MELNDVIKELEELKDITPEQALYLCGRVPKWEDEKPTPVKR